MKIAIIGTAGRNGLDAFLSKEIFEKMLDYCKNYITNNITNDWSSIILVSGGAAWSDHLAIKLHNDFPTSKLELHLPAKWDFINHKFVENKEGFISNNYHRKFSEKIGENSLQQLEDVINNNISINNNNNIVKYYNGFFPRNAAIAESDYLIAFTFEKNEPSSGGTGYTWKRAKGKKHHCLISNL